MKRDLYSTLVADRKACRLCVELRNPADGDLAEFDSGEVGPWTRLGGDLDADLMVIGQDWGDVRYYRKNGGLDDLRNPTVVTLDRLMREVGLDYPLSEYRRDARGLFVLYHPPIALLAPIEPNCHPSRGGV